MSDATGTPRCATARVRLRLCGQQRTFELTVPLGPRCLTELMPAARELADEVTRAALERERACGRTSSCGPACGACCRQLVAISVVEAQAIAELVDSLPASRRAEIRARFAAAAARLEEAGLLLADDPPGDRDLVARDVGSLEASVEDLGRRYFELQVACPFLEDESCSIHADRPAVCREYHVTSPVERCARLHDAPVDPVPVPRRVGDLLMRTAHETARTPLAKLPLVLSLEWSAAHGAELDREYDGAALFESMMRGS